MFSFGFNFVDEIIVKHIVEHFLKKSHLLFLPGKLFVPAKLHGYGIYRILWMAKIDPRCPMWKERSIYEPCDFDANPLLEGSISALDRSYACALYASACCIFYYLRMRFQVNKTSMPRAFNIYSTEKQPRFLRNKRHCTENAPNLADTDWLR